MRVLWVLVFVSLIFPSYSGDPLLSHSVAVAPSVQGGDDALLTFIQNSLDDGQRKFRSMDEAYYMGSILYHLSELGQIDSTQQSKVTALQESIIDFIGEARSPSGGYGNWKDAISSMESTSQAIDILSMYGRLGDLSADEVDATISFVQSLQTPAYGYYPLSNWDSPDVTSSIRALRLKDLLGVPASSMDLNLTLFFETTYEPPLFISGYSGYAEIPGGTPELLASVGVLESLSYLNQTDPHIVNVAGFIGSLQSPNGGVAGKVGSLPTTGYTAAAIRYYLLLDDSPLYNVSNYFTKSFLLNAVNYILGNRKDTQGFVSSQRDSTISLPSTHFAVEIITELIRRGYIEDTFDFSGIVDYIISGIAPTFGYGAYPSDTPSLMETTRALLLLKILGREDLVDDRTRDYIRACIDLSAGGYGFRPGAGARVKYTYYGLLASRLLGMDGSPITDSVQFIKASQTEDGGFGQFAGAILPYMSHTYWALATLNFVDALDFEELNRSRILQWVDGLRAPNGLYSNSPTSPPSIISTFRAIRIRQFLNDSISLNSSFTESLLTYQVPSGGFVNDLRKTVPTMEATYYVAVLNAEFDLGLNSTVISNFVRAQRNPDGGYALRPSFSSRMISSLYGTQFQNLLGNGTEVTKVLLDGVFSDLFSPSIESDFIPSLDGGKEFTGSYSVQGNIIDESNISSAHVAVRWELDNGSVLSHSYPAEQTTNGTWLFTFGPFTEDGYVYFQLTARDIYGNVGATDWYMIRSRANILGSGSPVEQRVEPLTVAVVIVFLAALGEGVILSLRSRRYRLEEVKTVLQENTEGNFNTLYLLTVIGILAVIARIYLITGSHILANSLLIFRFMLATVVILAAKYIIGIRTYGLFAPSVLVVSMVAVGPLWGVVIFTNVFALGYVVRSLLEPYNLPVGYRIGILMIFNVAYLGLLELLGEVYLIPVLSGSIFVPIIITPWIADRYVAQVREQDHYAAFTRFFFTMVITLAAYLLMGNDALVTFVATHPETWVLLVYFLLKLSLLQNYTLFDRDRFRRLFRARENPLSMQIRNRNYIARYNPPLLNPVINKFDMKMQFEKWNVPTPELLALITNERELTDAFNRFTSEEVFKNGFVIKPTQSLGGMGIVVVKGVTEEGNFIVGGDTYSSSALIGECRRILRGEYLSSQTTADNDIILVEELITSSKKLSSIALGLPDIRVIVFKGVPVMAMARLPTSFSDGKANLKQGAIGAGIDIASGEIFHAEWKQNVLERHPDTGNSIIGFKFNNWKEILAVACLTQKSSGLGYAGVDIVLGEGDKVYVLEINKRPGLEIQNINQASLLSRLELVEQLDLDLREKSPLRAAETGIQLARRGWVPEDPVEVVR